MKKLCLIIALFVSVGLFADWTEQQKILASDGSYADWFGNSVSINGDYIVIGALLDDDNGVNSGSAYIFYYNGTIWSQQTKLTASDGAAYDHFGCSVTINGNQTVIGAYQDDNYGSPDEWEDKEVLLVNYHRDFDVRNDEIIPLYL